MHLANPTAIQQYSGLKYTDDHSDARWLAHLLRLGVLPEGYIYPKAERAVRDVLRKRPHLVRQQTANVLSLQNIIVRNTGVRLSAKRIHALTSEDLDRLLPVPEHVLAVTIDLQVCFWKSKRPVRVPSHFLPSSAQKAPTPLQDAWQSTLGPSLPIPSTAQIP